MENLKKYVFASAGIALLLFFLFTVGKIWENVDANEIVVIQAPWSGELTVITSPGMAWQGYGKVTKYTRSFQYWFDGGKDRGQPMPIKFCDGGHAAIPGSIRVDLPLDRASVIKFHIKYGSQEAIENQLVEQVLLKSVYMSGATMTSKESYAEKKNDLLYYVEDQATHGVYKTRQKDIKTIDQLTGQEKVMTAVEIVNDATGKPLRQEASAIAEAGIKLSNLSFGDFAYDDVVKKQIAVQQQAIMQVQTGMANAKRAEQDAITVEQQGKADAAKAKWQQEVIKAQAVTEAQQKLAVAELNQKTEAQNKAALILKGEGEASYKRAVTQANNNIELKLNAWLNERKYAWDAFAKYQGNLVPTYMSGSSSGANGMTWMEAMGMQAMKQLNVEVDQKATK